MKSYDVIIVGGGPAGLAAAAAAKKNGRKRSIAPPKEYFTCFIAGDIESSERVRLGCGTRSEPEIV